MHPSQLSGVLLKQVPQLRERDPISTHRYADLILKLAAHCGKGHRKAGTPGIPDSALAIYCRRLERAFGLGGFQQINQLAGCIDHTKNWHIKSHDTKAYWLSQRGYEMIESARSRAAQGKENHLLDERGKKIRKRLNGVYIARDGEGRNAVTNAHLNWAVPVNLEAIEMVLEMGAGVIFPGLNPGRQFRIDSELRAIHACALNQTLGHGWIPQTYQEAESGRLYGTDGLSLQQVTREAKRVALLDAHEYDFANCHYRFLSAMAQKAGIEVAVINEYLAEPRSYRDELAAEIGISYEQAKKCLLAVLYGATKSLWTDCAIPMLIGPERAILLYDSQLFETLTYEVIEVSEHMRKSGPRLPNGAIVNCRGKACLGNSRRELSHLLQGLESALLHEVIGKYGDDILIIQHDGFTMSKYVDPGEIEALLSCKTGIEMGVTYEQLTLHAQS